MGTGFRSPPSASNRPSSITGVMALGIAMDALIAMWSGPCWNQTSRWFVRSVATAV